MKLSILQAIQAHLSYLPAPSSYAPGAYLADKTVIITGANIGLGFEAAKHLARMQPEKLILACRDAKKGADALEAIRTETGYEAGEVWTVDIASSESVKQFAERFGKEGGGKLDILIENAGVNVPKFERTIDGWERNIGTNHLGTAHLALRLLPYLLLAPKPRLVILASGVHHMTHSPELMNRADVLHSLNREVPDKEFESFETMEGMQRYQVSKTMNVLFGRVLARHLPTSSTLTVSTVDPGFCVSSLLRDHSLVMHIFNRVIARSTETGSRTMVHAAVAPELEGETGVYLSSCKVLEPSDFVVGKEGREAEDNLWTETIDILGKVDPEVPRVVQAHLTH